MAESRPNARPIFVSYARHDGGVLARHLQEDLNAAGFEVWIDTSEIEGGASWSVAIEQALDRAEIALVILSHAAHVSEICRAEQIMSLDKGKRVIPVLAQSDAPRPVHLYTRQYLDFSADVQYQARLAQLMGLLQADEQSDYAIRQIHARPKLITAPNLIPDFIARSVELDRLRHALLDDATDKDTILTALTGSGGVGKSVMASALCQDELVQAAFPDGVLWIPVDQHADDLVDQLRTVGTLLGDSAEKYTSVAEATENLHALLARRSALIVLDGVTDAATVTPFRTSAPACRVLVTTRSQTLAPTVGANAVELGAFTAEQAIGLLGIVTQTTDPQFAAIAKQLGNLPLALKLAGSRLKNGMSAEEWLTDFQRLTQGLPDHEHHTPEQAIALCFDLSVEHIPADDRRLYDALGVFQADQAIAQEAVIRLWRATEATLSEHGCLELIEELARLGLVTHDAEAQIIRISNLLHEYTRAKLGEALTATHDRLLRAYNPTSARWYTIPDDGYLYHALAYHLEAVGRRSEFATTMQDLRYIAVRALASKAAAVAYDVRVAINFSPGTPILQALQKYFPPLMHLLNRCTTRSEVAATLISRFQEIPELAEPCQALKELLEMPYLIAAHPLPDLPEAYPVHPTSDHNGSVNSCAIDPQGNWAVSASSDLTLKVWDLATGLERFRLSGHTDRVTACAASSDSKWIISASYDKTIKIWDAANGSEHLTLTGHTDAINSVAAFPDRFWLVSTSHDGTIKLWNAATGHLESSVKGSTELMNGSAVAPAGDWIVAGTDGRALKVWDVVSGTDRLNLTGHTAAINACGIDPNGGWFVSASSDKTLKVWDSVTGDIKHTLTGHTSEVFGCAASADGQYIASTGQDGAFKVWKATSGECLATFYADGALYDCVWTPDGSRILVAGERGLYWLKWMPAPVVPAPIAPVTSPAVSS